MKNEELIMNNEQAEYKHKPVSLSILHYSLLIIHYSLTKAL